MNFHDSENVNRVTVSHNKSSLVWSRIFMPSNIDKKCNDYNEDLLLLFKYIKTIKIHKIIISVKLLLGWLARNS